MPAPLRRRGGKEGEASEHTLGCPVEGSQEANLLLSRRPGLCRLLSCACLDLLLGPDFLTLPSLLAHLLALHSLSFAGLSMGKRFWRKSPYRWAFPSFQGRCRLETCLLFLQDTRCCSHPSLPPQCLLSVGSRSVPKCPACPLPASWCPHSCNPVTTIGDITHSWPGSQWCKKEQNVLGPRPAPSFTWAPPWPGQGR